jgi:hypothetical protein
MDASTATAGFALRTSARAQANHQRSGSASGQRAPWARGKPRPLPPLPRSRGDLCPEMKPLDKKNLLWYTLILWTIWTDYSAPPSLRQSEVS